MKIKEHTKTMVFCEARNMLSGYGHPHPESEVIEICHHLNKGGILQMHPELVRDEEGRPVQTDWIVFLKHADGRQFVSGKFPTRGKALKFIGLAYLAALDKSQEPL